ncbi:hypothetical protein TUM19329_16040 [Legionella antarctica]|uniref:Uncharacterized protein n=1 Tax=Legionella antarctica TaxID=2708020 RepID=A0A6F8T4W3_9GAMM|nr:hypothetical protein [Legionella antarctica]BCA95243.1 hypothetical protein TUM19329_16040 [Legionella antarctica]
MSRKPRLYYSSAPDDEQNQDALSDSLKKAYEEKLEFDTLYGELDDIVVVHKVAKSIADKISNSSLTDKDLAQEVNTSPIGLKLLTALGQYHPGLKNALNNNLDLFDAKGIVAIKEFVKYNEASLDTPIQKGKPLSIQQRLAFITILSEEKVNYLPYLNQNDDKNKDIIAAVFYLKKQKLTELITKENLNNKPFIDALLVLKEHEITLSSIEAIALAKDSNKCAIISQQNELYKKSHESVTEDTSETDKKIISNKIESGTFKALIEDFLGCDQDVIEAVNVVRLNAPQYCQHGLLMAVKESQPLRDMLNNEQNLKSNLPFLMIILENSLNNNILYLKDYYSGSNSLRGVVTRNMLNALNTSEILTQLQTANSSKDPVFNVKKMGVIMEEINKFIMDNRKPSSSQANRDLNNSLYSFRRETVPILLSSKLKPKDKKDKLEELADKHFKNTGVIDRLLECIFNAFEKILPAKVVSEYRSSFFVSCQNRRVSVCH